MDGWMDGGMDGSMDGWRRPNHMPSHLDALRTMASVDFRRVAGDFHSVAERASSDIAIWRDFNGFGEGFGIEIEAKIDFWEVFLRSFFRARFGIDFWSFFGGSGLEK